MSCFSERGIAASARRFWEPKVPGQHGSLRPKSTIRKVDVTHTANSNVYSLMMNDCEFESHKCMSNGMHGLSSSVKVLNDKMRRVFGEVAELANASGLNPEVPKGHGGSAFKDAQLQNYTVNIGSTPIYNCVLTLGHW